MKLVKFALTPPIAALTAFIVLLGASASAANYYWCGAGEPNADGTRNWEDPANWLKDGKTVVDNAYPGVSDIGKGTLSTGDQVWFKDATSEEAKVKLSRALTIGYLYLHQATTPVTLVGDATTGDELLLNNDFNCSTAGYPLTLDGIAVRRNGNITLGPDRALTLKNGANLYVNGCTLNAGATATLEGGSFLRSSTLSATADGHNSLTLKDGSVYRCEANVTLAKGFALDLSDGSQFLLQNAAGTTRYNFNAYGAVNTISLAGGSYVLCNDFDMGYPGQVITVDDSTIDVRGACLIGNTLPGGGDLYFKGAAPKLTIRGSACRTQNNNAGMNVPFVFHYTVPEGGYVEPPFQCLYGATPVCFGSSVNPTRLTKFVVEAESAAYTAGTETKTALAYSTSGFYWKAKANYTDVSDTTTGSIYFTDGSGNAGVTTDAAAKFIRATIGSGAPAPAPAVEESVISPSLPVAVNRKTFTATATVLAKSTVAAKTVVALYAGLDGADFEVVADQEISVPGAYDLSWTAPEGMFERNYVHYAVVTDYDAGGNVLHSASSGNQTAKSLDTTTYTWTGGGAEGAWDDPDNWSDNQGGDCLGFPGTGGATASFPAGAKAAFVQRGPMTVGWVYANVAGAELTFVRAEGMETNEVKWTFSNFNPNGSKTRIVVDGGCLYTSGFTLGADGGLVVANGANFHSTGDFSCATRGNVTIADDSFFSCNAYSFGGGTTVIRDAVLWTRSNDLIGTGTVGGHIRFEGTHPIWWHNNADGTFRSNLDNANVQIDFLVPAGGYAVAPIRAIATQKYILGWNGATKQDAVKRTMTFNILSESPANRTDGTITTTLVSWPKGIDRTLALTGTLPDDGYGTDDAWVWGDGDTPQTLGVTITGSTHANELQVTGTPEMYAAEDVVPPYGFNAVGETQLCTAPAGSEQLSDTKRVLVTGWKLYAVDAATHERSPVDSGTGSVFTYRNVDGLWHELEWQWQAEYRLAVSVQGPGSVSATEAWIKPTESVSLTATPESGKAFLRWSGDVPNGRRYDNPLVLAGDAARSVTAVFGPTVTVSPSGAGDYTTIQEALSALGAAGGEIVLAPDDYGLAATLVVQTPVTIRSQSGDPADTTLLANAAKVDYAVVKLAHADARLSGLTITKGVSGTQKCGGGVWMTAAAHVDHCRICSNTRGINLPDGGVLRDSIVDGNTGIAVPGVYMTGANALVESCEIINNIGGGYGYDCLGMQVAGGTVRGCIITNNVHGTCYGYGTGGVRFEGAALLDRCLVANNACGYGSNGWLENRYNFAAGVQVNTLAAGQVVTIRNSTIADNTAFGYGGLRVSTDGNLRLVNSIVWNNADTGYDHQASVAQEDKTYTDDNIAGLSPQYATNCCSTVLLGGRSLTADPLFVDPAHGDYRLAANSPCRGAGTDGGDLGYLPTTGSEPSIPVPEVLEDVYATPADDLNEKVLACGPGSTLHLADGDYAIRRTLMFRGGVHVVSDNGPEKTILHRDLANWTGANYRLLQGDDPDFLLSGVTITNCAWVRTGVATAVFVRDGTISNCVFRQSGGSGAVARTHNGRVIDTLFERNDGAGLLANVFTHSGAKAVFEGCSVVSNVSAAANSGGPVVTLYGGCVNRCRFIGNRSDCSSGLALSFYNEAGGDARIENSLFYANTNAWTSGTCYCGALCVNRANVTVANCTIVKNRSNNMGGGLSWSGLAGTCVGTVIRENVAPGNSTATPNYANCDNVEFRYCVFEKDSEIGAKCTECRAGDPLFTAPQSGDFTIGSSASPCVDKGDPTYVWLDVPPIDLAGRGRVNGLPDVGCYEYYAPARLACTYAVEGLDTVGGSPLYTAIVTGDDQQGLECRWRIDPLGGAQGTWTDWSGSLTYAPGVLPVGGYRAWLEVRNAAGESDATDMDGFVAHVPAERLYLAPRTLEGHVAAAPYTSEATAATNLADLVAYTGNGTEILVLDGEHALDRAVIFDRRVTIRSKSRSAEKASFYRLPTATMEKMIDLTGAGSDFAYLTVSNHSSAAQSYAGAAVSVIGGTLGHCHFTKNAGLSLSSNGSVVSNCLFDANSAWNYSVPSFWQQGAAARIEDCVVSRNTTQHYSDGAALADGGEVCRLKFLDNQGTSSGGALNVRGRTRVWDCLIARNRFQSGSAGLFVSGLANAHAHAVIENCTIVTNVCTEGAGGLGLSAPNYTYHYVYATNLIVWGNACVNDPSRDNVYVPLNAGSLTLDHTNSGEEDPLFLSVERGNYRLRAASPCRNAGANSASRMGDIDLKGRPRVREGVIDLGAYEYQDGFQVIVR